MKAHDTTTVPIISHWMNTFGKPISKIFLIGQERYVRINNTKKSTPKYIGHVQWAPNGRPQKSAQIPEDTQEDPSHSPKSN